MIQSHLAAFAILIVFMVYLLLGVGAQTHNTALSHELSIFTIRLMVTFNNIFQAVILSKYCFYAKCCIKIALFFLLNICEINASGQFRQYFTYSFAPLDLHCFFGGIEHIQYKTWAYILALSIILE